MEFDATFWVAISFVIFFVGLVYLKVPQKVNDLLTKMIVDIKKEIDESEKLRAESKELLVKAKNKLDSAEKEKKRIIEEAKSDAERLIIEMNDKFHKSSELKKNLAQNKINQMKDNAIKDIKKGDEFSYDYGFSFDEDFKNYPCKCKSKNCCGFIVREGSRWRIKKWKRERRQDRNGD